MNLKLFSDKIREQIEEDPNNPEIFNNLKLLAHFYFRGTKFVNKEQYLETISNIAAEDMYMKIYKGMDMKNPISYLYSYRYTYLKEMQKLDYPDIIDTQDLDYGYDMSMAIIQMCSGSSMAFDDDYNIVIIKDYLKRIPNLVDSILSKCCRYNKGTSIYKNIYTSILLSLLKNETVTFFISSTLHNYLLLMLNKVRDELFDDIRNNLLDNDLRYDGNLEVLLNVLKLSNIDMYIPEVLNNE